jgi:hypothetical protein
MKQNIIYTLLSLAVLLLAGCSVKDWPVDDSTEEGYGYIDLKLQGKESVSRSGGTSTVITKEEADLFLVTVTHNGEVVCQQKELMGLVHLSFPVGNGYKVFVESITEAQAIGANDGWGAKRFTGKSKSFGIVSGKSASVSVPCGQANAAVNIDVETANSTVTLVASDGRQLTTSESRVAYFNLDVATPLELTITVEKNGEVIQKEVTIEEPKQVNVNVKPDEIDMNQFTLNITYEDAFDVEFQYLSVPIDD